MTKRIIRQLSIFSAALSVILSNVGLKAQNSSSGTAEVENPVSLDSISPTGRFKITLTAGELYIQSGEETQAVEAGNAGFASERGKLGTIDWSNDGEFFLVSTPQGAHNQYSVQNLYHLDEITAGTHRIWSFAEVTLLNRLGNLALLDPNHGDDHWTTASISFSGKMLAVTLMPVGRNSHQFSSSDHFYKVIVMPTITGYRIDSLIREPGEESKELPRIIWKAKS